MNEKEMIATEGRILKLEQMATVRVVRTPVTCSACGELRTQIARCENCGNEKPFEEEKNVRISKET